MSDSDDVKVEFGANVQPLIDSMGKMSSSVQSAVDKMNGSFSSLKGAFEKINTVMLAVGAVLAGGKIFKECVDATNEFTKDSVKLASQLGITATEAATLAVALDNIGSDTETYSAAAQKLTKQVKTNEQGLKAMGIETRTATGELKNGQQLMESATKVLARYKEGTDRNMAAADMFGPKVGNVNKLLKLNAQALEDAARSQDQLNLKIGVESVARAEEYRSSMNDVGDVMMGLKKTIGDAIMPILSDLGRWFADIGPTAIYILKAAIGILASAFWGLRQVVVIVFQVIKAAILTTVEPVLAVVEAVTKAMRGDFEGAAADLADIPNRVATAWKNAGGEIMDSAEATKERLSQLFGAETTITKPKVEGLDYKDPNKGGDKSGMARAALAKAELEAANDQLQEKLKQEQRLLEDSYQNNIITIQEYYTQKTSIEQRSIDSSISMKRKEIEAITAEQKKAEEKGTPEGEKEVLKFKALNVKLTSDLIVLEQRRADAATNNSAQEKNALEKLTKDKQSLLIDGAEKTSMRMIENEQIEADKLAAMNLMTQEELIAQELEFENRKYEIARTAAQARLDLELNTSKDPKAVAALNQQLEQLEQQHQLEMHKMRAKAQIEDKKNITDAYKSMQSGFQNVIAGVLKGTMTISQAIRGMAMAVIDALVGMVAKMAAEWIMKQIIMMVGTKMSAIGQITANAGIAGSAATASAAAIPLIGWMLAPGAGAAAFAAAMAYAPAAAAEGGYDIPAGLNPVVQAHAKEMILPAKHADVIRSIADGNEAGGSGMGKKQGDIHLHVQAIDGQSVKKFFRENGKNISNSLQSAARNFALGNSK